MTDHQLRLRFIPYNARLMDAKKALGFTQKDLNLLTGIKVQRISEIFTLRAKPKEDEMDELAAALNSSRDYLFPSPLMEAQEVGLFVRRSVEFQEEELLTLTTRHRSQQLSPAYSDEEMTDKVDTQLLGEQLPKILDFLPYRERHVLTKRYGLDGQGSHTLGEVAEDVGVTKERIRQIESKALRKLRHPARSRELKDFLT